MAEKPNRAIPSIGCSAMEPLNTTLSSAGWVRPRKVRSPCTTAVFFSRFGNQGGSELDRFVGQHVRRRANSFVEVFLLGEWVVRLNRAWINTDNEERVT